MLSLQEIEYAECAEAVSRICGLFSKVWAAFGYVQIRYVVFI